MSTAAPDAVRAGHSVTAYAARGGVAHATLRRPCRQGRDHEEGSRWYTCLGCYAD